LLGIILSVTGAAVFVLSEGIGKARRLKG